MTYIPMIGNVTRKVPLWRSDLFEADEQNSMVVLVMEEISDCLKEYAHDQLDGMELMELIGYACPDTDALVFCIKHLDSRDEDNCVDGEFLRSQPEDGDEYPKYLDFAKRFKLITENEDDLTDLGRECIKTYQ